MILKQIAHLVPDDFRQHPIWVNVHTVDYDEEWFDETDEETFRPWLGDRPVGADELFLVSASLKFADGTVLEGFVTPTASDEGLRGLGMLQPQVFAPSDEKFAFWHGMFRQEESERRFYEAFARSTEQIFPIEFQALPGLTSSVASGVIPGFMSIPEGQDVVVTR